MFEQIIAFYSHCEDVCSARGDDADADYYVERGLMYCIIQDKIITQD